MDNKADVNSTLVAFVVGVAIGSMLSAARRVDRWLALDSERADADEGRDALTNYLENKFGDVIAAVQNVSKSLNDLRDVVAAPAPRRIPSIAPPSRERDGGH